jgi:hypothetical protein
MRSERGQATVEWIGIVLLVAVALAALSRLAPRAEGRGLAATVLHSVTHSARAADSARSARSADPVRRPPRPASRPIPRRESFVVPLLVPRPGQSPPGPRIRLPEAPALLERARRGGGTAWRRAWIACLVYERFRYAFLHPESRFPGHTIPPSEVLRMANDCISPVDLVRDWPLVRGR